MAARLSEAFLAGGSVDPSLSALFACADAPAAPNAQTSIQDSQNESVENPHSIEHSVDNLSDDSENDSESIQDDHQTSSEKKLSRRERNRIRDERNARSVFVGNLPVAVTERKNTSELAKLFAPHGKIESIRFRSIAFAASKLPRKAAFIQKNFHPSRSSLNAYIVYASSESVQAALALNNSLFMNHHIRVDRADAAKPAHDHARSIFLGNLPFDIDEESVYAFFADCGDIEYVRIVRDKATNVGKGFGYVQFVDRSSVALAQKLNKTELAGRPVRITRSVPTLANKSKTDPSSSSKYPKKTIVPEGTRASRNDKFKPKLTRVSKKTSNKPATKKSKSLSSKPKAVMAKRVARAKAAVAAEDRRKSSKK